MKQNFADEDQKEPTFIESDPLTGELGRTEQENLEGAVEDAFIDPNPHADVFKDKKIEDLTEEAFIDPDDIFDEVDNDDDDFLE